jgi:hypothetical protein
MTRSIDRRLQGNTPFLEADLDQAVAISFSVQQSKEALYSYADTEFSAVADGKVIVMGKLITNISNKSHSNHIADVLRGFEQQILTSESGNRNVPATEVWTNAVRINDKKNSGADLTQQEINWFVEFVFAFPDFQFNINPSFSVTLGGFQGRYNTNLIYRNGRADQHNLGFDLIIQTWETKVVESIVLKDISIRSIEQERSPTDQPIVEIYDFIARTVIYGANG